MATGREHIFLMLIKCMFLLYSKIKKKNNMCGIWKTYSLCLSPYSLAAAAVAPVDASPAPRVFVAPVSSSVPAPVAASLPAVPVVAYTHINMDNTMMRKSKWLTIMAKC